MFPITIPTLVTEEVYQRFAWSVFIRGKGFLLNILIFIGIMSLYLTFIPEQLKRFSVFTVLFASLITFSAIYFGMDFQIKKAYQKTPFWKDMEQTLIFEKDKFSVKRKRGAMMTSSKFFILRMIFISCWDQLSVSRLKKRTVLPRLLSSC